MNGEYFGTFTVTSASFSITAAMGISYLSLNYVSGSVNVLCSGIKFPAIPALATNSSISLTGTFNVGAELNTQPLDGITVDASAGVVEVFMA